MNTNAIHVCGTGSGVGKSFIVAGLCRLFLKDGYDVAPFKAQNMALNSYVTEDGKEIGRAQVVQAQGAKLEPTVDMNPILLKPSSDTGAQVIIHGRSIGNMSALEYTDYKAKAVSAVHESYDRLSTKHDLIVMEGAGSPAEINLKEHDIVNIKMAEYADCPVILVGDIDKGGVFAWLVGTLELLTEDERARVKGFIINKFRGDVRLLYSGLEWLENKTGIKVLGVIPYQKDLYIPEEDSVYLESIKHKEKDRKDLINIDVVCLPHISNFTDFDMLAREPDVVLRYVRSVDEIENPDLIIVPGSKNTIGDLAYIKEKGIVDKIKYLFAKDEKIYLVGICGGYQMLGEKIVDPFAIESSQSEITGMNLLPIETKLDKEKVLTRVKAVELSSELKITGYEIHQGVTNKISPMPSAFKVIERNGESICFEEGCSSQDGRVVGTYIHGLFDDKVFRRDFINRLRTKKGWDALDIAESPDLDYEFDKLAEILRENLDMDYIYNEILSNDR